MKIAIPILKFNKEGGIERHTYELAKRFSKEHEIHIFANQWVDMDNVIFNKVSVIKIPALLQYPSFVVVNTLMLKRENFDIIYNNGCGTTLSQDIITSASLHKAWAKEAKKEKIKKYVLNPLHYWTFTIEGYNYKNRRYKKIIAVSNLLKNTY